MHEASIVYGLMKILEQQASAHNVTRIKRVNLKIGKLRAVEPQSLHTCFEMFAEGTAAEGAELTIKHIPAQGHCASCGQIFDLEGFRLVCPTCGETDVALSGGNDLCIESFET